MLTTPADSTIRGRNLNAMEEEFCNADIMTDSNRELRALHEADPNGRVTVDSNRIMTFTKTSGLVGPSAEQDFVSALTIINCDFIM